MTASGRKQQKSEPEQPAFWSARKTAVVITCEHGGNQIPAEYHGLFRRADDALKSHRGWDPGALRVAQAMADKLQTPFFFSESSRLLIELNRSPGHRQLFSEYTVALPHPEKQSLITSYYHPYRYQVQSDISRLLDQGVNVLHLSIHSFTPIWDKQIRRTSIGLLYDPTRRPERVLCSSWKTELRAALPGLVIHSNQPYLGIADGFTTYLRKQFPLPGVDSLATAQGVYAGVEVEINQSLIFPSPETQIRKLANQLCSSLSLAVHHADERPA